jgi:hypothetical protein
MPSALGVYEKVMLKLILKVQDLRMWTEFDWTEVREMWQDRTNFGLHTRKEMPSIAELLFTPQVLCSVQPAP